MGLFNFDNTEELYNRDFEETFDQFGIPEGKKEAYRIGAWSALPDEFDANDVRLAIEKIWDAENTKEFEPPYPTLTGVLTGKYDDVTPTREEAFKEVLAKRKESFASALTER